VSTAVDKGTQDIQFSFKDPLNSSEFDLRNKDIISPGMYKGGFLTKVTDASVTVSPVRIEIDDGTNQVRMQNVLAVAVTVSSAAPFVILRWTYNPVVSWFVDFLAVAESAITATDLIVGEALYSGPTLTGFSYARRSVPWSANEQLKVVPLETPVMKVHINGGFYRDGGVNTRIQDQDSNTIVAPVTFPRIDLVLVNRFNTIEILAGAEAATPVAKNPGNATVLAELHLKITTIAINEIEIRDARAFASGPVKVKWIMLHPDRGTLNAQLAVITAGDRYYLAPGTYTLGANLTITQDDVELQGAGEDEVTINTGAFNLAFSGDLCSATDLSIDNSAGLVGLAGADRVERVTIIDAGTTGFSDCHNMYSPTVTLAGTNGFLNCTNIINPTVGGGVPTPFSGTDSVIDTNGMEASFAAVNPSVDNPFLTQQLAIFNLDADYGIVDSHSVRINSGSIIQLFDTVPTGAPTKAILAKPSSLITVDLDASGANGLDTGIPAVTTWYNLFLIGDTTGVAALAGLLSLSATAPTLPGTYDVFRRIGSVRCDSLGPTVVLEAYNKNGKLYYLEEHVFRTTDPGTSFTAVHPTSPSNFIPPTSKRGIFGILVDEGTGSVDSAFAAHPDVITTGGAGKQIAGSGTAFPAGVSMLDTNEYECDLDSSQDIALKSTSGVFDNQRHWVIGYIESL